MAQSNFNVVCKISNETYDLRCLKLFYAFIIHVRRYLHQRSTNPTVYTGLSHTIGALEAGTEKIFCKTSIKNVCNIHFSVKFVSNENNF